MKNKTLMNIWRLVIGTGLAQIIAILASPILTRLYSPSDFGIFATFSALISILIVVASGKYEMSIILPKKEWEAVSLYHLSILILFMSTGLFTIIIAIFGNQLISFLFSEHEGSISLFMLFWIPLSVFFMTLYKIQKQWQTRLDNYKIQSHSEILRSLSGTSLQIIYGISAYGAMGLLIGQLIGQLVANLLIIVKGQKSFFSSLKHINKKSIKEIAVKYKDFPKFNLPQNLLNQMSNSSIPILLTAMFNPVFAGLYALANKVIKLPSTVLSDAVKTVVYKRLADKKNKNERLYKLLSISTILILFIMVWPSLLIIFFGPLLFGYVFGAEWRDAGVYAQWLMPLIAMQFINKPAISTIKIYKWQSHLLKIEVASTVFKTLGFVSGAIFLGPIFAVAAYSLIGALINMATILFVVIKVKAIENKN